MLRISGAALLSLLAVCAASPLARAEPAIDTKPAEPPVNPWSTATDPSSGPAQSLGGYSAGCLDGGQRLPERGKGFRVAEPARGRFFAHPAMIAFIRDFAGKVAERGLGELPIGDLSQARGGPAPSGHASHQTGLDADIWYVNGRGKKRLEKVEMVDLKQNKPSAAFDRRIGRILALAAADERVDRIFVNPVIKRELCAAGGSDRGWLRKIRPWWLHHEHFHVRLACPADSPACEPQSPIGSGDGCAEVDWWLQPKAEAERSEKRKRYRSKQGVVPTLPARCSEIVPAADPRSSE